MIPVSQYEAVLDKSLPNFVLDHRGTDPFVWCDLGCDPNFLLGRDVSGLACRNNVTNISCIGVTTDTEPYRKGRYAEVVQTDDLGAYEFPAEVGIVTCLHGLCQLSGWQDGAVTSQRLIAVETAASKWYDQLPAGSQLLMTVPPDKLVIGAARLGCPNLRISHHPDLSHTILSAVKW